MGEFLIIMGLVVFYNLFKIIFNIIRIIFLKKKGECTEFCVNSKYNIWYRMVVLSSCF